MGEKAIPTKSHENEIHIGYSMAARNVSSSHQRHPHHCFYGRLHLITAMKLLICAGILVVLALLGLESVYFRRAIFIMLIPAAVIVFSVGALIKQDQRLLWPIIGISFFHIFLDAYLALIFSYFFFFKPLYIIMVLNWAFDTLHTTKTTSYYINCACIATILVVFFLFNLWQLRVSLRFQNFLGESQARVSNSSAATISTNFSNSLDVHSSGNSQKHPPATSPAPLRTCKLLNEAPIIRMNKSNGAGYIARRASLTETRRFGAATST